ncbi:HDOD domain-containing protein [Thioalkalivibrio sulfidiphilus]|uniref:HDOD domain-containing protein n=1 Tax=Thioalkalivibrio sulfidiphilus TaxID=1033854 RepID=UPI003B2A085A
MTHPICQELIREHIELGSLPDVYHRIEEAVNDPTSSFDAMARLIEHDPALTAQVLKLANSPLYGFPYKIQSVARAVSIIGTQQLRDVVLAATVIRFFNEIPLGQVNMESFWRHSIACGLVSRAIATFRREPNVERFYVCGLLHDLGRLVMFMHLEGKLTLLLKRRDEVGDLLYKVEQQILGFDHAALGGALLEAWRLPPAFSEAVRFHHNPGEASNYPVETAVVHVADSVANALRMGTSGERFVPPVDPAAWNRIALPGGILEQVIEYTEQHYQQAVEVFLAC